MSESKSTPRPHDFGRPPATLGPCGVHWVVRVAVLDNPIWSYAQSWDGWLFGAGLGDRKRRRIEAIVTEIEKWPGVVDVVETIAKGFDELYGVSIGVEIWVRFTRDSWVAFWYDGSGREPEMACFCAEPRPVLHWERVPE